MKVDKILGQWYDVNCYCITNDKNECLLVEAGAELEDIKELVCDKKVQGILLTHAHFDHALYLKDYIEYFKVPVFASKEAEQVLKDSSLNQGDTWKLEEDLPITYLEGDGNFEVGNFKVEYFSAPGHSPCCMCFKIDDILFAGDVLFHSGIGRIDLNGSDKDAMKATLDKLEKIEFDMLYSGHGEESDFARQKRNIAVFKRFLNR